jgi:endoglucanase
MKQAAAIFLFSVFIHLNVFAQSRQTPVAINGALRVQNGKVVNQHGVQPQLRGTSFSWSLWQGRKYWNPAVVDWVAGDFKVSMIRAAMAIEPAHGYLQDPSAQKALLESLVDEAIKEGIYVLIDWHDDHSNLHLAQSEAFYAEMAKRYKGAPNVIYEIWNEPGRTVWDTVKNYALRVIPTIRKYDPDNIIVVGSPHWDQDVDIAAANPITGFKNIAYSFHFYASDPNHQEKLRAKADTALKKGLPLIVTEWGVGWSDGNGKFDPKLVAPWFSWLEQNKLSWTNWNITDKPETTALLLPGAPVNGGWTEDQLSPAGLFIRNKLRELNK